MASIVSAGTTSATALNMSADTTGILQLASNNGTVALTVDTSQNFGFGNSSPATAGYGKTLAVETSSNYCALKFNSINGTDILFGTVSGGGTQAAISFDSTAGSNPFLNLRTGGLNRLTVNSSGYVTTQYQPSFLAGSTDGDTTVADGSPVPFNSVGTSGFNVGSGYSTSTYLFTAPVAGKYIFNFNGFFTNSAGNTQAMQIAPKLNGSYITVGGDVVVVAACTPNSVGGTMTIGGSVVLNLAANDTVGMYSRGTAARFYMGHTKFSGYLLG